MSSPFSLSKASSASGVHMKGEEEEEVSLESGAAT